MIIDKYELIITQFHRIYLHDFKHNKPTIST